MNSYRPTRAFLLISFVTNMLTGLMYFPVAIVGSMATLILIPRTTNSMEWIKLGLTMALIGLKGLAMPRMLRHLGTGLTSQVMLLLLLDIFGLMNIFFISQQLAYIVISAWLGVTFSLACYFYQTIKSVDLDDLEQ